MERLTFDGNFCDIAQCSEVPGGSFCEDGACSQKKVWERLKAYEDTGWTPEMLHKLGENAGHLWDFAQAAENMTVGRLKELAEADKDGRLVVLPCKAGTPVWRISRTFATYPDKSEQYVRNDTFFLSDLLAFGKTVFRTREEAEKALQEMEGKKDG